jgi:hypothetical protein
MLTQRLRASPDPSGVGSNDTGFQWLPAAPFWVAHASGYTNVDTKVLSITLSCARPLTLIDPFRVLVRNGPGGGSLADMALRKN